jgi:hypothetical protein
MICMTTEEEKQDSIARTGEFLGIGAAGVTAVLAKDPCLLALASFFPTLGEMAMSAAVRRFEGFWRGFAARAKDDGAAKERLNASTGNANAQDAVLETFRRVQSALDPEVAFALGRLLWPYASGELKPDRFFRDLGSLLTDIDIDDLLRLRAVLRAVRAHCEADTGGRLSVWLNTWTMQREPEQRVGIGLAEAPRPTVFVEDVSGGWLFPMLKRYGFAGTQSGAGADPEHNFEIRGDVARAILEVIDVEFTHVV